MNPIGPPQGSYQPYPPPVPNQWNPTNPYNTNMHPPNTPPVQNVPPPNAQHIYPMQNMYPPHAPVQTVYPPNPASIPPPNIGPRVVPPQNIGPPPNITQPNLLPPNVAPPNFYGPPAVAPNNFPRFSGPINNQPTFPMPRGAPPTRPQFNSPPPPFNSMNTAPPFSSPPRQHVPPTPQISCATPTPQMSYGMTTPQMVYAPGTPQSMPTTITAQPPYPTTNVQQSPYNTAQVPYGVTTSNSPYSVAAPPVSYASNPPPNRYTTPPPNQRQMPCFKDNVFNDGPKDAPSTFPFFNPRLPPPMNPGMTQSPLRTPSPFGRGGGFNNQHGGNTRQGFHGNKGNHFNNKNQHNDARGGNSEHNRGRGRGSFHNNGQGGRGQGHHRFQGKGQGEKKPFVDKRDLPENNAFRCDVCDKGFRTKEKYDEHISEHIKCSHADCPFSAAPKLVQFHINAQHRKGMAKKIWSLQSAEDINKWKEDRKRNYPTLANIKKKKEIEEEKRARGEVIDTEDFSKMSGGNKRGRGRDRGRGRGRGQNRHQRGRYDNVETVDDEDDDGPPEEVKIKRSRPNDDKDTNGHVVEVSDDQTDKKAVDGKEGSISLNGKVGKDDSHGNKNGKSVVAGYLSTSDNDDVCIVGGDKSPKSKTKKLPQLPVTTVVVESEDDSDIEIVSKSNGKVKKTSSEDKTVVDNSGDNDNKTTVVNGERQSEKSVDDSTENKKWEGKSRKRGRAGKDVVPNKKAKTTHRQLKKSYTLLEKLLANEIRRERNKILQCVHFLVKNRFFDE